MTSPATPVPSERDEPEVVEVPAHVYAQQRNRAQAQAHEWEATATVLRAQRDDALGEVARLQSLLNESQAGHPMAPEVLPAPGDEA